MQTPVCIEIPTVRTYDRYSSDRGLSTLCSVRQCLESLARWKRLSRVNYRSRLWHAVICAKCRGIGSNFPRLRIYYGVLLRVCIHNVRQLICWTVQLITVSRNVLLQ